MPTETTRLIRDGEKGEGVWRWGKRESIYTYRNTVTTRMTLALRWAARANVVSLTVAVVIKQITTMGKRYCLCCSNYKGKIIERSIQLKYRLMTAIFSHSGMNKILTIMKLCVFTQVYLRLVYLRLCLRGYPMVTWKPAIATSFVLLMNIS